MKILLGVGRTLVDEHGNTRQLQTTADILEIEVPGDGQYLSRIWMTVDGLEVLNLPLTMEPSLSSFA